MRPLLSRRKEIMRNSVEGVNRFRFFSLTVLAFLLGGTVFLILAFFLGKIETPIPYLLQATWFYNLANWNTIQTNASNVYISPSSTSYGNAGFQVKTHAVSATHQHVNPVGAYWIVDASDNDKIMGSVGISEDGGFLIYLPDTLADRNTSCPSFGQQAFRIKVNSANTCSAYRVGINVNDPSSGLQVNGGCSCDALAVQGDGSFNGSLSVETDIQTNCGTNTPVRTMCEINSNVTYILQEMGLIEGNDTFYVTTNTNNQAIYGTKIFTQPLTINATANQFVVGATSAPVTLSVAAVSSAATYTFPNAGADANIVMDHGAYTIAGSWTFSSQITFNNGIRVNNNLVYAFGGLQVNGVSDQIALYNNGYTYLNLLDMTLKATQTLTIPVLNLPTGIFVVDSSGYSWALASAYTFTHSATFSSGLSTTTVTATATSNQLVLGTTKTTTISATAPVTASVTCTIPDFSASATSANFVVDASGYTQTLAGTYQFSHAVQFADVTDSIHIGSALSGSSALTVTSTQTNLAGFAGTANNIVIYDSGNGIQMDVRSGATIGSGSFARLWFQAGLVQMTTLDVTISGTGTYTGLLTASGGIALTSSSSQLKIQPGGTGNAFTVTTTNPGQATTLTIPDPGTAAASFVLTQGAQTLAGATYTFSGGTASLSTTTGTIVITGTGGLGVGGAITAGGNVYVGSSSGSSINVLGTSSIVQFSYSGGTFIYDLTTATSDSARVSNVVNFPATGTASPVNAILASTAAATQSISSQLAITSSTPSTSTTTGALTVNGGFGALGSGNFGGYVAGTSLLVTAASNQIQIKPSNLGNAYTFSASNPGQATTVNFVDPQQASANLALESGVHSTTITWTTGYTSAVNSTLHYWRINQDFVSFTFSGFSGTTTNPGTSLTASTSFPSGYTPPEQLVWPCACWNNGGANCYLSINNGGQIVLMQGNPNNGAFSTSVTGGLWWSFSGSFTRY